MVYEVWHLESGNLIGAYSTREEAFALIRDAVTTHGQTYGENFMVGQEDRRGRFRVLAQGKNLVALVLAEMSVQAP